jgi:hypothetical protein
LSYKTNIPNATDFLAISQKQLLANYQAIFSSLSKNHVVLNSVTNSPGNHTSLTMTRQSIDPTTAANQVAFYNKDDASVVPQLFYRPNNNQTPIQMTNDNLTASGSATEFRRSTFLPGTFTLYTGFIIKAPDNTLVTLLPATTLVYAGIIGLGTSASNAVATNIAGNQFRIRFGGLSPSDKTIYYMAIGI